MTLAEARAELRELVDDGHACPCCTQFAKVYRRKIHATMARQLVYFYRRAGTDWFDLPQLSGEVTGTRAWGGDAAKLRYWALLVEADIERDDGGRAGWWRLTSDGVLFVCDELRVPKYARIYDGRCLGLIGEPIGIRDALGDRFDYRELMSE